MTTNESLLTTLSYIIRMGYLEDRLEYPVDELASTYDLDERDAQLLYNMLRVQASGLYVMDIHERGEADVLEVHSASGDEYVFHICPNIVYVFVQLPEEECGSDDDPITQGDLEGVLEFLTREDDVPGNVFDYFADHLAREPSDQTLRDLPCASECGQACVKAIDFAQAFIKQVNDAFGYGQYVRDVIHVADRTVTCLWRG